MQVGEMGVEQSESFANSAVVIFFAVARGGFEFSSENYVLSFGEPKLGSGTCGQSLSNICTPNVSITDGWESIVEQHYPTENSPGALYIRRIVNLLDGDDCLGDEITRTVINDTFVEVSGTLVLSSFTECGSVDTEVDSQSSSNAGPEVNPFLQVRTYPFSVAYNRETGELIGLTYDLLSYSYTTKTQRIIDSPVYGTIVELEIVTERLIDRSLTENSEEPALPSRLTGAVISNQELNSQLSIAAVSPCQEEFGTICTQSIFFGLSNRHIFEEGTNLTGSIEVKATVYTPSNEFQSVVQLRALFDVDTKVETGELSRLYDVFVTNGFFVENGLDLYIKDAENSTQLTLNSVTCVNVIRLDKQHLNIHSIFMYADDPQNETATLLTVLYVPDRVSMGVFHSDTDWSARFCFMFSDLIHLPPSGLTSLYFQVDYGQKSDIQFFEALPKENGETTDQYVSEPLTGIMTLQRRSLYLPKNTQTASPNQDEVSDPQLLYFHCPYAGQCYYHGYCVRCSGWDTDDVGVFTWVFLSVFFALTFIVIISLCWCYPGDAAPARPAKADK